jgi:hypothetical protein
MFENLSSADWWFLGLATLAGFFVVKHFLDKLPGNQDESGPQAQSYANSKERENFSRQGGFTGFDQKAESSGNSGWFRSEDDEFARNEQNTPGGKQRKRESQENDTGARASKSATGGSEKLWYEVLDVSSISNLDEIKLAYKKKIRQYHPDKVAGLGPEFIIIAEAKSKEINEAYKKGCAERSV